MYWFFYLSISLSIYLCISIIKYSVFMFMKKQKNTHKTVVSEKLTPKLKPSPTSCSWSHKSCNSETSPAGSSISTGGTSTEGTATACTARPAWPAWPVVVSTGGFTTVGFLGFLGEASKGKLFFCWELATSQREAFVVFYPVLFSYSICFFSGPNQTSKKKHAARLLKKLMQTI